MQYIHGNSPSCYITAMIPSNDHTILTSTAGTAESQNYIFSWKPNGRLWSTQWWEWYIHDSVATEPAVPVLGNSGEFPGVKTFVWLSNIGNYFFRDCCLHCTAGKGGQCSLHSWVKYCLGIQRWIQQNVCPPPPKNTRYIRPVPYTESKGAHTLHMY